MLHATARKIKYPGLDYRTIKSDVIRPGIMYLERHFLMLSGVVLC